MIDATFLSLMPLATALGFSATDLVLEEARFFFFGSVSLMVGFDFSVMVVVLGFFVFVGC